MCPAEPAWDTQAHQNVTRIKTHLNGFFPQLCVWAQFTSNQDSHIFLFVKRT